LPDHSDTSIHADWASHRRMCMLLHYSICLVSVGWPQLHAICKIWCQEPCCLNLCNTLGEQRARVTASASNYSGQRRADLRSRAVGRSPNVHEAAKEMDALGGFGDLPVCTPGTPTQPQSPLHPGLSLSAAHSEHNDVPVVWVCQQDTRGSIPQDSEAIYYSLLFCTHIYGLMSYNT